MDRKEQHADFLAKAKDADEMALKTPDSSQQEGWQKIAECYRELAKRLVD
jgi:hypothetical protein